MGFLIKQLGLEVLVTLANGSRSRNLYFRFILNTNLTNRYNNKT